MATKTRRYREDDPHVFGGMYGAPKLEDESRFHVIKRVPIIDKHDHPKKGNVDEKLLKLLMEKSNERAKAGDLPKVQIGHTKREADEKNQPEIVGFARNFQLGKFRGNECLFADFHVRTNRLKDMLEYPFRSIERWDHPTDPDGNYIPAIAVLRTDPERDLGLLTYAKSGPPGARLVRYSRDMGSIKTSPRKRAMPDKDALCKTIADLIRTLSDSLSALHAAEGSDADDVLADENLEEAAMGEETAEADDMPEAEGAADDGPDLFTGEGSEEADRDDMEGRLADELDADEDDETSNYAKSDEEPMEEKKPAKLVKNAAASGTNTFMPTPGNKPKKEQYSKADLADHPVIKKLAADVKELVIKNKALQTYSKALEVKDFRKEVLSKLVAEEGIQINVAEELEDARTLDDAGFDKFVDKIKRNYGRSPVGDFGFLPQARIPRPGDDEIGNDDVEQLVEYCMSKGVSMADPDKYEKAMKQFISDKKAGTLVV